VQEGGEFGRGGAGQGGELLGLLIDGVRRFSGRYFELEELRQWWFGKVTGQQGGVMAVRCCYRDGSRLSADGMSRRREGAGVASCLGARLGQARSVLGARARGGRRWTKEEERRRGKKKGRKEKGK
jgi:hypothetical protein